MALRWSCCVVVTAKLHRCCCVTICLVVAVGRDLDVLIVDRPFLAALFMLVLGHEAAGGSCSKLELWSVAARISAAGNCFVK